MGSAGNSEVYEFLITPSLVTQMWAMSFFDYSEEYRRNIGMVDNLVRLALGLGGEDIFVSLCGFGGRGKGQGVAPSSTGGIGR